MKWVVHQEKDILLGPNGQPLEWGKENFHGYETASAQFKPFTDASYHISRPGMAIAPFRLIVERRDLPVEGWAHRVQPD